MRRRSGAAASRACQALGCRPPPSQPVAASRLTAGAAGPAHTPPPPRPPRSFTLTPVFDLNASHVRTLRNIGGACSSQFSTSEPGGAGRRRGAGGAQAGRHARSGLPPAVPGGPLQQLPPVLGGLSVRPHPSNAAAVYNSIRDMSNSLSVG